MKKEYYNIRLGRLVAYAEYKNGRLVVKQNVFRMGKGGIWKK